MKSSALVLLVLLATSLSSSAQDVPLISWSEGPALDAGRDHHAVFNAETEAGDFLFVAGGTDYREMFSDVWRARVNSDGSVDEWTAEPSLPMARGGHSVAVGEGVAVLTGGQFMEGLRRIAEVYTARIDNDGRLSEWMPAPPLPRPAFHHPAVHHNGWIYVTGGQGEKTAEATVFGARLTSDGTIDEWVELTPLPRPRSHHASFVHNNALYVVGGLDGHPALGSALYVDAWRAPIQPDGSLGPWVRVSVLPNAYGTHSAFVHDDFIYVLGGVENDQRFVDTIWRAPIDEADKIGAWEAVAPGLPTVRAHVHNTPVINGRIYSLGGSHMRKVSGALHIGTFQE